MIVPQMRDYDELGSHQEWVPHLMYFQPRNAVYNSVTTDDRGMRTTVSNHNNSLSTALLIGGSSVFGIGATSDAATIPSRLNTLTEHNWLNLGGRAFNSTQEALLVHLSNFDKITGPIVVMSGINNLTRALMPGSFSPMYGAFFQQSFFEQQMKSAAVGNRALVRLILTGILERLRRSAKNTTPTQAHTSNGDSYASMLTVFQRDCKYLQMIAKHHGTTTTFVLQPFIPWLRKNLSGEEMQLFALLDNEASDFARILDVLAQHKDQYRKDIQSICEKVGMRFLDLNNPGELEQSNWLFVDRAHFTDLGNDTVAKLLVRDLSL